MRRIEANDNAAIRCAIGELALHFRAQRRDGTPRELKERVVLAGSKVLITTGANIDFLQLGLVAPSEGAASTESRTPCINIPERPGTMLDSCFEGLNIAHFQYGLHHPDEAWPVFTFRYEPYTPLLEAMRELNTRIYPLIRQLDSAR